MRLTRARNTRILCLALLCGLAPLVGTAPPAASQLQRPALGQLQRPPVRLNLLPGFFSASNPKVVVLLHGATDSPVTRPQSKIGTLEHARRYFGFSLVGQLLGNGIPTLYTLSNARLDPVNWDTAAIRDSNADDHFIVASATSETTPPISVMLTHRDGSLSLASQAKAAVRQIHDLYTRRFAAAAKQPQIILVCHSMGGLVSRYILTNPTGTVGGGTLTAAEREQADFIRSRTICLVTLATPHEGSPLADKVTSLAQQIRNLPSPLEVLFNLSGTKAARDEVLSFLGARSEALNHLKTAYWSGLNRSQLSPEKAVRPDGSLVPIYCLGGRTPAWKYLSDPNNALKTMRDDVIGRKVGELTLVDTIGLIQLDRAMHNIPGGPDGWGSPPSGSKSLDWVRRCFRTPTGTLSEPGTRPEEFPLAYLRTPWSKVGGAFLPLRPTDKASDGEIDNDGMVPLDSALGIRLGTTTAEHFDHSRTWTAGGRQVRGSWYRLYDGPWNEENHGTIRHDAPTGKRIYDKIIKLAGPYPAAGDASGWTP